MQTQEIAEQLRGIADNLKFSHLEYTNLYKYEDDVLSKLKDPPVEGFDRKGGVNVLKSSFEALFKIHAYRASAKESPWFFSQVGTFSDSVFGNNVLHFKHSTRFSATYAHYKKFRDLAEFVNGTISESYANVEDKFLSYLTSAGVPAVLGDKNSARAHEELIKQVTLPHKRLNRAYVPIKYVNKIMCNGLGDEDFTPITKDILLNGEVGFFESTKTRLFTDGYRPSVLKTLEDTIFAISGTPYFKTELNTKISFEENGFVVCVDNHLLWSPNDSKITCGTLNGE